MALLKGRSPQETEALFTQCPLGKALFVLAWPVVLNQLTAILYNLSNTFFTGRSGDPKQVAALTLGYPLCIIMTALANLFGAGAGSAISLALGAGERERARRAGAFAFYGGMACTLGLSLAVLAFTRPILGLLGADESTYPSTYAYVFWIFIVGAAPTVLSLVMGYLLRAEGNTREASGGLMLAGFLNLAFSPLFISVFDLGAAGAAMATTAAYSVSLAYFLWVFARLRGRRSLSLSPRAFSLKGGVPLEVLRLGLPLGISSVLTSLAAVVMSRLTAGYGSSYTAAYDIAKRVTGLTAYVAKGMTQGAAALICFNFGAGDLRRARGAMGRILGSILAFSLLFMGLLLLFAPGLGRAFIRESPSSALAAGFIRAMAPGVVGTALFLSVSAFLQGVGAWKRASLLNLLRNGLLHALFPLVFNRLFGPAGLMCSLAAADTLSAALALCMYRRFWRGQSTPRL